MKTKPNLLAMLWDWLLIGIFAVAGAAVIHFFMLPAKLSIGSIPGLALVLGHFIPLSVSAIAMIMIGGLLIGDAAVKSGLISTPVLTVAALAATAGFVIPEHHAALTVLRPAFILAAAAAGLPAVALLGVAVLFHICGTEIFGYPISAPIAPILPNRLSDIFARIGFRRLSQSNFHVSEIRRRGYP